MTSHRIAHVTFEDRDIEVDVTEVRHGTTKIIKEGGKAIVVEWIAVATFRYLVPLGLTALGFFGVENVAIPYPGSEAEQSVVAPAQQMKPAQIVVPVYTATPQVVVPTVKPTR